MGDPIINTQVDAINATLGNIKVDLAALRPSIRAIKDAIAETYITDTIENVPIASFNDGADEIPVRELQVAINPIQSLNGQTSPYPAGGGKNLLPMTLANIKSINTAGTWNNNSYSLYDVVYTVNTDEGGNVVSIKANGTASQYSLLRLVNTWTNAAETILSGTASGSTSSGYRIQAEGDSTKQDTGGGVILPANYSATRVIIVVPSGVNVSNAMFYPMIRLSSVSDATFAPYSNICPISGHTEAVVTRTGVNVWDEEWEQGLFDGAGNTGASTTNIRTKNNIPVQPNTTYYAHIGTSGANLNICFLDENGGFINRTNYPNTTFTTPQNCRFIKFSTGYYNSGTYKNDISINYPSTATDYEPFGQTYPISLGQTVYGGTLNGSTGVMTITKRYFSYSSATLYGNYGTDNKPLYYVDISDPSVNPIKRGSSQYGSRLMSNYFKYITGASSDRLGNNEIRTQDGFPVGRFYFRADSYDGDINAVNAAFSATPLQIVAELNTPITVQLTATEVETLFGQNNVWTNTNGNIVKLTYRKAWEIALAEGE